MVLTGASGIGKSSLLGSIQKKVEYTGQIECGEVFNIFQDTEQLFTWCSILKNLKFANPAIDWIEKSKPWGLDILLNNKPNECSVGQRQRLTLLRAVYSGYKNLLCDEPMSGVDEETAENICLDFKELVEQKKLHVVWVTHDQTEAKILTEKIITIRT